MEGHSIALEIYADSEEEAMEGRQALVDFIAIMAQNGAAVRGSKLKEAVSKLNTNPFIKNQIIKFFRYGN